MSVGTSAGTKISIADPAGAVPSSGWQEVGSVVSIGEFGRTYSEITFTELGSRDVLKFKGSRNDGNIALQLGKDVDDAGQDDMNAALNSDEDHWFKIELNDAPVGGTPTTITFEAKVMSFTTNVGGTEQVVGASANLGIKSGSITETAHAAGGG